MSSVKGAWSGPARLQLFEHALAPLADLPVREIVSVSHILTDLTLAPTTSHLDYLARQCASERYLFTNLGHDRHHFSTTRIRLTRSSKLP